MSAGGPRPASELVETLKSLTPQQSRVLDLVVSRPEGFSAAKISKELGIHVNTVREHLDVLLAKGLVRSERAPGYSGSGRPRLLYIPLVPTTDAITKHFISLVNAGIALHGEDSNWEFAREWGRAWARLLLESGEVSKADSPLDTVIAHMVELGFAPTVKGDVVSLHRCPLLPADGVIPEAICQIHGGMIEELLSSNSASEGVEVEMTPFAGCGTCTVRLLRKEGAGEEGSASGGAVQ